MAAVLLTVGLAVSLLPILLSVLRPRSTRRNHATTGWQLWVTLLGLILSAALWFLS